MLTALISHPAPRPPAAVERVSDSIIQIGIIQRANRLLLRPEGTFSITDQKNGNSHVLENSLDYPLTIDRSRKLRVGPYQFQGQVRLAPRDADDYIRVDRKKYRGNLVVRPNPDATFTVIEELGIEEYLYGVLPAEMSHTWPMEALKAQAVVARTFALNNLGKFKDHGFDLSDDSRSQVYADIDNHAATSMQAVDATERQILYYKGDLLPVYFHSTCGGHTTSQGAMWGGDSAPVRPLRGVSDRWCSASPHTEWSVYIPEIDIINSLSRRRFRVAKLRSISVGRRDRAGYAQTLRLNLGGETIEIRANDFRNFIGNTDLKSTKITRIKKRRIGYQFEGRGFGHGVGLCQYGAKAMAERGKNYRQILAHYFPGADLVRIKQ